MKQFETNSLNTGIENINYIMESINKEFSAVPDSSSKTILEQKTAKQNGDSVFHLMDAFFTKYYKLDHNEITGCFEINGCIQQEKDLNTIFIEFVREHPKEKNITKQNFETFLNSTYIPSINPIKEYFLKYPAPSRTGCIKDLVDSINIVDCPELEQRERGLTKEVLTTFFTKWLVGMVAGIYDANYNCLMIVLIGPKGSGKTEFFRRFLPKELRPFYADSKFDQGKDDEAKMCENLMILNDELHGLNLKDARQFRNFISSDTFYHRPPYGKQNIRRKRLASCCGTSNDKDVIDDIDNNRRIIPVEIKSVNIEKYNNIDKGDLIREAHCLFRQGQDWNLTNEEIKYLDIISQQYAVISPEKELLMKYVDEGVDELTATEIKAHLEYESSQKISTRKLGSALRQLGYKPKHMRVGKTSKQVYTLNLINRRR